MYVSCICIVFWLLIQVYLSDKKNCDFRFYFILKNNYNVGSNHLDFFFNMAQIFSFINRKNSTLHKRRYLSTSSFFIIENSEN